MDEAKFMKIGTKVMSDDTEIEVTIDIKQAWVLVSGLQLLCRHPGVSPQMKDIWTHTGRQFQEAILVEHPEAEELMEMGWNTDFDVDEDGEFVNNRKHKRIKPSAEIRLKGRPSTTESPE